MNKHTVLAITMAFAIAVIAMASIPEESDAATVTLDSETIGNYLNEETQQYEFSEGDYVLGEKFGLYSNQITHPMVFSGACTLDLNGFDILPTNNVQYGIINQGVLTVKDTSEDKTGSIALSYYSSSSMGVAILNEGSLTVDGGSFTADYSIMNSASNTDTELVVNDVWALSSTQAIRVCSGSVEINGGDITDGHDYGIAIIGDASEGSISVEVNGGDISASSGAAILVQGSNDSERPVKLVFNDGSISVNNCLGISGNGAYDYTDITIKGGSIESQNQVAVFNPQIGDLTVTGGTITGYTGIQFCGSGTLTIDDGTITGTGECKPTEKEQEDGTFDDGAAVSLITRGNGYQDDGAGISVRINGGTFESKEAAAIQSYKMAYYDSSWHTGYESGLDTALDTVDIRGGKFTSPDRTKPISYDSDDESTGIYVISGGTYSADVDSTLLDPAYMMSGGTVQPNPEAYVAQNGDRFYVSLEAAVEDAAEDDTIVMTVDELTLAGTLTVPKGITIDLGEGTLILAADGDSPGGIKFTSGESTIRNGTIQDPRSDGNNSTNLHTVDISGKDTILNVSNVDFEVTVPQSSNSYNYAVFISGGSTLTLDGSSISEVDQTGESWFDRTSGVTGVAVLGPGSNAGYVTTLAVTDTTIETRGFAIAGSGNEVSYGTRITLGQGTVINTVYAAVYHPQDGELVVDGASITGRTGIEIRAGSLEIMEGSSITSTGHFTSTPNGSGVTSIGAAVAVVQHTTKQPIDVTITGGTFQGERAFFEGNTQGNEPLEGIKIEISGGTFIGTNGGLPVECLDIDSIGPFISKGTFSSDVSQYCVDDYVTVNDGNGNYVAQHGYTVTFIVNGVETIERVPFEHAASNVPAFPTADAGYGYVWMAGDSQWLDTAPIIEDIEVTATLVIADIVVEIVYGTDDDGQTMFTAVPSSSVAVDYEYMWVYEGKPQTIISEVEYITSQGVGAYYVLVTGYDANDVFGYGYAMFTYRMPVPEDPDEQVPTYDIVQSGQELDMAIDGTEILITSSGTHSDVDIQLGFTDMGYGHVADIQLTADVTGGDIVLKVTPTDGSDVANENASSSEYLNDTVSVDVVIDTKVTSYDMIIKIPIPTTSGSQYLSGAVAFYTDEHGVTTPVECYIVGTEGKGSEVWIYTDHNTQYTVVPMSYSESVYSDTLPSTPQEPDNPGVINPPIIDDDDDYVPPIYVPSDTSSSDDDTVKIVACAAAAVVAAMMAAFLILGHRRE